MGTSRGTVCRAVWVASLVLSVIACAGQDPPPAEMFAVGLADFEVRTERPVVSPGRYVFQLSNAGPTVHELVVARVPEPGAPLPFDATGLLVDEESMDVVAADESVEFLAVDPLAVDLAPGEYVLFCNIEGHYRSGMFTRIAVRPTDGGR